MASKRKYSDLDDSDDEEPTLGRQVLPVASLPLDFSGEPEDGLQYLFMVRRDARQLPRVTRVVNPYEVKEEPRDANEDASLRIDIAANLPSQEWREVFLGRFKNFRQNCAQPTIHVDLRASSNQKVVPDRKDRDAWWAFLTGRPESEWNPPKKPKKIKNQRYGDNSLGVRAYSAEFEPNHMYASSEAGPSHGYGHTNGDEEGESGRTNPAESLPTPSGTPAPPDPASTSEVRTTQDTRALIQPPEAAQTSLQPEPTSALLRDIDSRYALHLLMYFAHWINLFLEKDAPRICDITETHARWMFVLLSRVDEYISADETSTLRSLARGCIGLIRERMAVASGEGGDELNSVIGEPSCWMIVTAIIGVWAQHDLWQDAETMLSEVTR